MELMRTPLLSLLGCFALAGTVLAQTAPGAHFTIVQASDGKTVGSAGCSFASVAGGYQVTSSGELHLGKFNYSFTNANHVDSDLNIIRDQLSGTVNGARVDFTMASDATGRQFQVDIRAQGKDTTNTLQRHPHLALLADLDPAAYVEMVHFALEEPPTAWAIIPKQNGILVPAEYDPQPEAQGNFNGQPAAVHHTSIVISGQNAVTVEIYYNDQGVLLEADLPEQNFYVIHDGFQLQNRPKYTPPQGSAPPPNPQNPGGPTQTDSGQQPQQ
jgi:hypothetical protein